MFQYKKTNEEVINFVISYCIILILDDNSSYDQFAAAAKNAKDVAKADLVVLPFSTKEQQDLYHKAFAEFTDACSANFAGGATNVFTQNYCKDFVPKKWTQAIGMSSSLLLLVLLLFILLTPTPSHLPLLLYFLLLLLH